MRSLVAAAVLPLTSGAAMAWCVVGVERGDTLQVRAGPGPFNRVVGNLGPKVCGIKVVGPCADEYWCRVAYRDLSGWANTYYMVSQTVPGTNRFAQRQGVVPALGWPSLGGAPRPPVVKTAARPAPPVPEAKAPDPPKAPRQKVAATPKAKPWREVEKEPDDKPTAPPESEPTPKPVPAPQRAVAPKRIAPVASPRPALSPETPLIPSPTAAPPSPPTVAPRTPERAPERAPEERALTTTPREACIQGVARGETLKVRAGPSATSELRYGFLPDTCGVKVTGDCKDGWCPVEYRGYKGWAEDKYLK